MRDMLVRHGPPGKLDEAQQGTRCKVDLGDNTFDIYVQSESLQDHDPRWIHQGNFTEESYELCMTSTDDNYDEID